MALYLATLIAGFLILIYAADRFVIGTAAIARNLGISPLIIGLTIVGFGTSAPEILISVIAASEGNSGLAVGNAIGSNIANIGLILGFTAVVAPITIQSAMLRREMPLLLATNIGCFVLILNGGLSRLDGFLMLSCLAAFLFWLVKTARENRGPDPLGDELEQEIPRDMPTATACFWAVAGLAGLLASSKLLVWAGVNLAQLFGISDLVIGLTIVALGTSLPELAASVASILKHEDDIAIGNVIGSNMYNLLAVLALPGIIAPGDLDPSVLSRDFPWMIGFTITLFVVGFSLKSEGRINRLEGGILIGGYGLYQYMLYLSIA